MLTPGGEAAIREGLAAALEAGAPILEGGGSALDAVEAAARVLEDDPAFNAGRGAVLTREGAIELDAAIMDGTTLNAGAVAGLTRTRHPISAARAVSHGESFIRAVAAHEIGARIRLAGEAPQGAADAAIAEVGALGGSGGVIFAAPSGEAGWSFNTASLYRGLAGPDGARCIAIYRDE